MSGAPRDDILVSVCVAGVSAEAGGQARLVDLAKMLAERFRYWEMLFDADVDEAERYEPLLNQIGNARLLLVRGTTGFYRRRALAASEAIGDVVALTSVDELATVDIPEILIAVHEGGAAILAMRERRSALDPLLRSLGRASGFRVSSRQMLTSVYPRTLLNRCLAHNDPELALRFPPRDIMLIREWVTVSQPRHSGAWGRRLQLIQKLIVNSAPAVLGYVASLSALMVAAAISYGLYAIVTWLVLETVAPGWLTLSLLLSLIGAFLGLAFFGIATGLRRFANSDSQYQYDNLANLKRDIETSVENNLKIINVCSEPWRVGDLHKALLGTSFTNVAPPVVTEDVHTEYAGVFGRSGPYLYSRKDVLRDLIEFVNKSDS